MTATCRPSSAGRPKGGRPVSTRPAGPALLALVCILGYGCRTESSCGSITIAQFSWASAEIAVHTQDLILRKGYGCEPELVQGNPLSTITSMAERGEPDIAPDVYLNNVSELVDQSVAEGRLKIAGRIVSDGGEEGWYVPAYVVEQYPELSSLEGVLARPDLFPDDEEPGKGRLYTCPTGWACQVIDANLFRAYGLEQAGFTRFDTGSGEALAAAIARAYERREPIFAYYWSPTSLLSRYEMHLLQGSRHDPATWPCIVSPECENPARNYYPRSVILTLATPAFADRSPEHFDFLARMAWESDLVNRLLGWMDRYQATAQETADYFLRHHESVWMDWVPPEVATRVKVSLERDAQPAEPDRIHEFPTLGEHELNELKRSIDSAYRTFSRAYGEPIEHLFDPLLYLLILFEELLLVTPWWVIIVTVVGLSYGASRSVVFTAAVGVALLLIGYLGMWDDTVRTLAMTLVSTLMTAAVGIPIGILMARFDRLQAVFTPILDAMQTMPVFVYLIPVVMLFGIGKVPGLIAVVIYAVPPLIHLTNLGIRLVSAEMIEAADAFGTGAWRKLVRVQLPLALPNIMAGVNQSIMMVLSMIVTAAMIGVRGLGQPVLQAVTNQYFALGLFNGAAVVTLAIALDRITQGYARRLRADKHL